MVLKSGIGHILYVKYFHKHVPRIVCIRGQWNHSDLSGRAPRVGSGYGHFEVLGGGV